MADSCRVKTAAVEQSNERHLDLVSLDQECPDYVLPPPQRSCAIAFFGPPMLCLSCNGRGYVTLAVDPATMQLAPSATTAVSPAPSAMIGAPVAVDLAVMQPSTPPAMIGSPMGVSAAVVQPAFFPPLPNIATGPTAAAPGMLEGGDSWWSGNDYVELGL